MRAIAAINTALDVHLSVPTLISAPSMRSLSHQLGRHASPARRTSHRKPGQAMARTGCMRIADVLPLTPLQQGLLFHASTARGSDDDVYAVQLNIGLSGGLDQRRLRDALYAVVNRHPHLVARFSGKFDEPAQIVPADPWVPWRCVDIDADDGDVDEQVERVCAAERAAVCDLGDQPVFRAMLIRIADDRHRFVLTNHHIVMDGWSLPILVRELFASYDGQRLPAPGSYRRFVSWLAGRDGMPPGWPGLRCWLVLTPLPWWVRQAGRDWGGAPWRRFGCPSRSPARSASWRAHSTPPSTSCLQGAFAQLLMGMTGRHDVVFGTTVSGRSAEVDGAESMVGLLINTVPVRASITAATTTADLLDQLHGAHNQTFEHQHLALSDIHRITGQQRLFDTVFVYENYPIDTAVLSGIDGLAVTEFTHREYNHYPLAVQAVPGTELGLRVEYDTDVFDTAGIDTLFQRFIRVLAAMTTDPTRRAVIDRRA